MQTLAELRPDGSIVVEEAPSSRPAMHSTCRFAERKLLRDGEWRIGVWLASGGRRGVAQPSRHVIAFGGRRIEHVCPSRRCGPPLNTMSL